ncbi:MAG: GIY-YIG nuclease family protein [Anaerolineae bacterium]|nr:GIY-YIG nuclease family protein [Anaerolineae bacterium]
MIDLHSLSKVSLKQYKSLPACSGIYFALIGKNVLYIGKSTNINSRWKYHHRREELSKIGDVEIAFLPIPKRLLEKKEKEFIDSYKPLLNNTPAHLAPRLQVEFTPEILAALSAAARAENRTLKALTTRALIGYLASEHPEIVNQFKLLRA